MARIDDLLKAIAVTAELTSTVISEAGARIFADDLRHYRLEDVLDALTRCRRELKSKLTVAAVIERMDNALELRQLNSAPRNYDCEYEVDGLRCKYPGANAQNHKGPWYCRIHATANGTLIAQQALERSQSYRAPPQVNALDDLLNEDLLELNWLTEHCPMRPGETREDYNDRCKVYAMAALQAFRITPMAEAMAPIRLREPGEDEVEI